MLDVRGIVPKTVFQAMCRPALLSLVTGLSFFALSGCHLEAPRLAQLEDQPTSSVTSTPSPTPTPVPPNIFNLVLTSFTGGQYLVGGSTHFVTWSASSVNFGATPISIDVSSNGGTTWTSLVGPIANSGSYSWTLPGATNSSTYQVRVNATDTLGNQASVTSTSNFVIDSTSPLVSLTDFTGGQYVESGVSQNITWSASDTNLGPNPISLYYSTDGGTTWTAIASAIANASPYSWNVPSVSSATVKIKVVAQDLAGNVSNSLSGSNLTLDSTTPSVTLTSLTGGQYVPGGVATNITWTATGTNLTATPITIDYSSNGGTSWTNLVSNVANSGTYSWSVPSADSSTYQIRVKAINKAGTVGQAVSASNFTIDSTSPSVSLTSLTGGQYVQGGATTNITWSASDTNFGASPLTLSYSTNAGSTWTAIATVSNSGSYSWSVPSLDNSTVRVEVTAVDLAGNSTTSASTSNFSVLTTAPTLSLTSLNGGQFLAGGSTTAITWMASDSNFGASPISLLYSTNSGSSWTAIATVANSGTYTWTVPSTDSSTCEVKVIATDLAGNATSAVSTAVFTIDSTAPSISLTSLTGGQAIPGGSATAITWSASDTNFGTTPIEVDYSSNGGTSWTALSAGVANSGTYSWTPTGGTNSTTYKVRVIATDKAGNTATSASSTNLTVDSTPPTLASISINNGAGVTTDNYVNVALTATDNLTNITKFCLKYNSTTAPTATDSCWVAVNATLPGLTPAQTLTMPTYTFTLGFTSGFYSVYAWTMDQAGNISTLTNSGAGTSGTDLASITYNAPSPPVLTAAQATSADAYSTPFSSSDLTVANSGSVYIKWNASTTQTFGANPISLYYTTDGLTYTTISTALPNVQGTGCTINGSQTGCYVWTNTVGTSYFQIRVGATDTLSHTSFSSSLPLNVGTYLNFLAGNTDTGTGGNAKAASFINYAKPTNPDIQSFVVSSKGIIYFRDRYRGILKVDPTNGNQTLLIPLTGVSTDGAISGATVNTPGPMTIDPQDRLLFYDLNAIRRYDPVAATVSTIIGGSSATQTGDTTLPLQTLISPLTPAVTVIVFTTASDGTIYFQSENYASNAAPLSAFRIRAYNPSGTNVTAIYLSGTGDTYNGSQDLTACGVNFMGMGTTPGAGGIDAVIAEFTHNSASCSSPTLTSTGWAKFSGATDLAVTPPNNPTFNSGSILFTGLDGQIYSVASLTKIQRYNKTTGNWDNVAGNGTIGSCADGSAALTCPINPSDMFTSSSGQVYFLERGQIRLIDPSGNLVTLAGQSGVFGDGGAAIFARFGNISDTKLWNDGTNDRLVTIDSTDLKLREFTIGSTISTIAGNGSSGYPLTTAAATSQPLANGYQTRPFLIEVNPTTGEVYSGQDAAIFGLNRGTGMWVSRVGGAAGTNYYYSVANGTLGSAISTVTSSSISGGLPSIIGYDGTNILAARDTLSGTSIIGCIYELYSTTASFAQTALTSTAGTCSGYSSDGTTMSSATSPSSGTTVVQTSATWDSYNSLNQWVVMKYNSKPVRSMTPGGSMGTIATLPHSAYGFTYRHDATHNIIYYCSQSDLKIHSYNVATSTDVTETWPVASLQCTANSVTYSATRGSLIFTFTQNGEYGVAEYLNP